MACTFMSTRAPRALLRSSVGLSTGEVDRTGAAGDGGGGLGTEGTDAELLRDTAGDIGGVGGSVAEAGGGCKPCAWCAGDGGVDAGGDG